MTEGASVLLRCSVTGDPEPVISWLKDGEEIVSGESYQVGVDSLDRQNSDKLGDALAVSEFSYVYLCYS